MCITNVQMNLLDRMGGHTIKETVKLSMNRLFTNRAMSYMSLDGRSLQKLAFRHHPVCQVITGMMFFCGICYACVL